MKKSPKTVQIEFDLFVDMVSYITSHVDPFEPELKTILNRIMTKLTAMERRDTFTAFKTGSTPSEYSDYNHVYNELMNRIGTIQLT